MPHIYLKELWWPFKVFGIKLYKYTHSKHYYISWFGKPLKRLW